MNQITIKLTKKEQELYKLVDFATKAYALETQRLFLTFISTQRYHPNINRHNGYEYIPNNNAAVQAFLAYRLIKRRSILTKIIDLGSGSSPFLFALKTLNTIANKSIYCEGIENDKVFKYTNFFTTLNLDLIEYVKSEEIKAFDILYFYHPIVNSKIMFSIFENIIKNMKVGAYLIPHPMGVYKFIQKLPSDLLKKLEVVEIMFENFGFPHYQIQKIK